MKIAFSSKGKDRNSLLDVRFGRCEYFQVYDTENNELKVIENKGQVASGGAGIAASNQLIDEKIDVVVTGSLGPNAFDIIKESEIKMYKCDSISIENAIEKYNDGQLEEIESAK